VSRCDILATLHRGKARGWDQFIGINFHFTMNERRGYKLKLGIKDAKQLKVMRKAYFQLPAPSP
jgi:hypothetical protein